MRPSPRRRWRTATPSRIWDGIGRRSTCTAARSRWAIRSGRPARVCSPRWCTRCAIGGGVGELPRSAWGAARRSRSPWRRAPAMADPVPLLIIGAGPYGLAMSAYANHHGIAHVVAGRPMDFWASQMPRQLYLRSGCDWHLDPFDEDTIEGYLEARNLTPAAAVPLSRDVYLDYCDWLRRRKDIRVAPTLVRELNFSGGPAPCL